MLGPYDHDHGATVPEPSPIIAALSALNIAEFAYRKEPWALDLYDELLKARKRWAEVVAEVLADENEAANG